MKKFLCLMVLSLPLWAQTGFICSKQNVLIERVEVNGHLTLAIKDRTTHEVKTNANLQLPLDGSQDAYQERFGTYYVLMEYAQTHLPFMPDFLMVYHLNRMTSLLKKGFKAFETPSQPVQLNKLYCRLLQEAILNY